MARIALDHAAGRKRRVLAVHPGPDFGETELALLNGMRELVRQERLGAHFFVVSIDHGDHVVAGAVVGRNLADPKLGLRRGEALGRFRKKPEQAKPARRRVLAGEVLQVEAASNLVRVLLHRNRPKLRRRETRRFELGRNRVVNRHLTVPVGDVAIELVRKVGPRGWNLIVATAQHPGEEGQRDEQDARASAHPKRRKRSSLPLWGARPRRQNQRNRRGKSTSVSPVGLSPSAKIKWSNALVAGENIVATRRSAIMRASEGGTR